MHKPFSFPFLALVFLCVLLATFAHRARANDAYGSLFEASSYYKDDNNLLAPSFSGYVSAFVGFGSYGLSNIDGRAPARLHSYTEGNTDSRLWILPFAGLFYTFEDGKTQIFMDHANLPVQGDSPFAFGVRQLQYQTLFSLAVVPPFLLMKSETYSDPFYLEAYRQTTDMTGYGLEIKAKHIYGSPFSAHYEFARQNVQDENSGDFFYRLHLISGNEKDRLRRSGFVFNLGGDYTYAPEGQNFRVVPDITLRYVAAKGGAYSTFFPIFGVFGRYDFAKDFYMSGAVHYTFEHSYSDTHPIFRKTRKDSEMKFAASVGWEDAFQVKNLGFETSMGYRDLDSNINFYDENEFTFGLTTRYRF